MFNINIKRLTYVFDIFNFRKRYILPLLHKLKAKRVCYSINDFLILVIGSIILLPLTLPIYCFIKFYYKKFRFGYFYASKIGHITEPTLYLASHSEYHDFFYPFPFFKISNKLLFSKWKNHMRIHPIFYFVAILHGIFTQNINNINFQRSEQRMIDVNDVSVKSKQYIKFTVSEIESSEKFLSNINPQNRPIVTILNRDNAFHPHLKDNTTLRNSNIQDLSESIHWLCNEYNYCAIRMGIVVEKLVDPLIVLNMLSKHRTLLDLYLSTQCDSKFVEQVSLYVEKPILNNVIEYLCPNLV